MIDRRKLRKLLQDLEDAEGAAEDEGTWCWFNGDEQYWCVPKVDAGIVESKLDNLITFLNKFIEEE